MDFTIHCLNLKWWLEIEIDHCQNRRKSYRISALHELNLKCQQENVYLNQNQYVRPENFRINRLLIKKSLRMFSPSFVASNR